jgi:hypothetical protein
MPWMFMKNKADIGTICKDWKVILLMSRAKVWVGNCR